ncbi:MAG: transglutaminase domain-containing protein [Clostridia bacterium]|nr:transglutaminase domain-containing protein [Clostridia bacterium]
MKRSVLIKSISLLLALLFTAVTFASCEFDFGDETSSPKTSSSGQSADPAAPVITGEDVSIAPGETLNYYALVKVTTADGSVPELRVDMSAVDNSTPGVYPVVYTATDGGGRSTEFTLRVTVKDVTPPTVTGEDLTVYIGDTVSYRNSITVSDDTDPEPEISVDNSLVNLNKAGVYPVTYTVRDSSGNEAVFKLNVTVLDRSANLDEYNKKREYVESEASKQLAKIVDDSMDDLQKAYAIYYWTKKNIAYTGSSDKSNYIYGAYDGFKKRAGDCYTYFSVSKALLIAAGIDNVDVVKERTDEKQSRHYWMLVNVGDGWYHFDSTPYKFDNDNFFMVTTAELHAWDDKYYPLCHNFLTEGLPEISTKSIQHYINYRSSKLNY